MSKPVTVIRFLVALKGLSNEQAAIQAGVHPSELSRVANRLKKPSKRTKERLEKYFEVPLDVMLSDLNPKIIAEYLL